jgi:hypothetical protein
MPDSLVLLPEQAKCSCCGHPEHALPCRNMPIGYRLWENPCAYCYHVKMLVDGEWRLLCKNRFKMTFLESEQAIAYAREHFRRGLKYDEVVP